MHLENKGLKRYCDIYLRECQKIKSETAESIGSNIAKIIKNTLRKYPIYIGKGIRKPSASEGMLSTIATSAEVATP